MELTYLDNSQDKNVAHYGESPTSNVDFVELLADERDVQGVGLDSDDPACVRTITVI